MKEKKVCSYVEYADVMVSMLGDLETIAKKHKKAVDMLKDLPEPTTVRDEAIRQLIDNTTESFISALDMALTVVELYNHGRHVVRRR